VEGNGWTSIFDGLNGRIQEFGSGTVRIEINHIIDFLILVHDRSICQVLVVIHVATNQDCSERQQEYGLTWRRPDLDLLGFR